MTSARWMTLFSYLAIAITVAVTDLAYYTVGGGPGAGILAIEILRFGIIASLAVALLALGFAVVEARASQVRTVPTLITTGAAALVSLVLLIAGVRLWFF